LKGFNNVKKNYAQLVYQKKLFYLVKLAKNASVLNVLSVKKHLYGKGHIIKSIKKNTGSIFGLKKVTQLGN